jgi:hypothetical protein
MKLLFYFFCCFAISTLTAIDLKTAEQLVQQIVEIRNVEEGIPIISSRSKANLPTGENLAEVNKITLATRKALKTKVQSLFLSQGKSEAALVSDFLIYDRTTEAFKDSNRMIYFLVLENGKWLLDEGPIRYSPERYQRFLDSLLPTASEQ